RCFSKRFLTTRFCHNRRRVHSKNIPVSKKPWRGLVNFSKTAVGFYSMKPERVMLLNRSKTVSRNKAPF
ncbi:MAG: hypothetical protein WCI18_17420, partial [Pseudomonadota bacterium]